MINHSCFFTSQVATDEDSFGLTPLEPGKLMASHYIRLGTMINICAAPDRIGMEFLLGLLAKSQEFEHMRMRRCVLLRMQAHASNTQCKHLAFVPCRCMLKTMPHPALPCPLPTLRSEKKILNEINKGPASKYPLLLPNGKPKDKLASGPEKVRQPRAVCATSAQLQLNCEWTRHSRYHCGSACQAPGCSQHAY
jgi:hypothetical protein